MVGAWPTAGTGRRPLGGFSIQPIQHPRWSRAWGSVLSANSYVAKWGLGRQLCGFYREQAQRDYSIFEVMVWLLPGDGCVLEAGPEYRPTFFRMAEDWQLISSDQIGGTVRKFPIR